MKKGKTTTRSARRDILKSNASSGHRKARRAAREKATYDRQEYDGSNVEEAA